MTVDYKQLRTFVKEAMFTGGGINEPSAPEGVPHRTPAADDPEKEQNMGDSKANELYAIALAAREATEDLVEALDDPVYDGPYENAFKASACLRRVLNEIQALGAHPMPSQHVVPPPTDQQKYAGFGSSYGGYNARGWGGNYGGFEEGKLDVAGVEGVVKEAIELYKTMTETDRRAFQSIMLSGARRKKV